MTLKDLFFLLYDLFQGGWQAARNRWNTLQARRPISVEPQTMVKPYRILSERVQRRESQLPYLIVLPIASCLCLWLCFLPIMLESLPYPSDKKVIEAQQPTILNLEKPFHEAQPIPFQFDPKVLPEYNRVR